MQGQTNVDAEELGRFDAVADQFWNPDGPFAPLHRLGPTRLRYLRRQITPHRRREGAHPLDGVRVIDIGCGGGLVSEPLARLGANVLGIDASDRGISTARAHAAAMGVAVEYQQTTVAALLDTGHSADVVLALEVIEHVPDPRQFVHECAALVRPGGLLIFSTLNRTARSFALGIVAAEYVLGWVPRGTHDWRRFVPPATLTSLIESAGGQITDVCGLVHRPLSGRFALDPKDTSVNYFLTARMTSLAE